MPGIFPDDSQKSSSLGLEEGGRSTSLPSLILLTVQSLSTDSTPQTPLCVPHMSDELRFFLIKLIAQSLSMYCTDGLNPWVLCQNSKSQITQEMTHSECRGSRSQGQLGRAHISLPSSLPSQPSGKAPSPSFSGPQWRLAFQRANGWRSAVAPN